MATAAAGKAGDCEAGLEGEGLRLSVRQLRGALHKRLKYMSELAVGGEGGVYGEITAKGLMAVFHGMRLQDDAGIRFVDIGSGIGRVLLAARLLFPRLQLLGVEVDAQLFALGEVALSSVTEEVTGSMCGIPTMLIDARCHDFTGVTHAYFFDAAVPPEIVWQVWTRVLQARSILCIASHKLTPARALRWFPTLLTCYSTINTHMCGSYSQHKCYCYAVHHPPSADSSAAMDQAQDPSPHHVHVQSAASPSPRATPPANSASRRDSSPSTSASPCHLPSGDSTSTRHVQPADGGPPRSPRAKRRRRHAPTAVRPTKRPRRGGTAAANVPPASRAVRTAVAGGSEGIAAATCGPAPAATEAATEATAAPAGGRAEAASGGGRSGDGGAERATHGKGGAATEAGGEGGRSGTAALRATDCCTVQVEVEIGLHELRHLSGVRDEAT